MRIPQASTPAVLPGAHKCWASWSSRPRLEPHTAQVLRGKHQQELSTAAAAREKGGEEACGLLKAGPGTECQGVTVTKVLMPEAISQ